MTLLYVLIYQLFTFALTQVVQQCMGDVPIFDLLDHIVLDLLLLGRHCKLVVTSSTIIEMYNYSMTERTLCDWI